jgi:hypothetical protein
MMFHATRTVHVVALGLWFGSTVFFTFVVGLSLFGGFERLGEDTSRRPAWFPLPTALTKYTPSEDLLKRLGKEQGTRAAGFGVTPMFDWYFLLQSFCSAAALVTALSWARLSSKVPIVHKIRTVVLLVGVASVALGWWLEQVVSAEGKKRDETSDVILTESPPTAEQLAAADAARANFGFYHGCSMMVNLVTVLAAGGAMALAAYLPEKEPAVVSPPR